jgi:hypothetical protein
MDDPRFLQFFADPPLPQQRRYEAIRAVFIEGQPLQTVAARFGFAYGTLRNLVAQFRACIRQGRTPPFSLRPYTGDPRANQRPLVPISQRSPTADCSRWIDLAPSARAWPGSSCSCRCSLNSAWIAWCAMQAIPARA